MKKLGSFSTTAYKDGNRYLIQLKIDHKKAPAIKFYRKSEEICREMFCSAYSATIQVLEKDGFDIVMRRNQIKKT